MTSFWCEAAIVGGVPRDGVRIEERDGVITSVSSDQLLRDADLPLHGLVLPGLANGHSHAFHRALRGRTHADGGTFWNWRERMYGVATRLDPQAYFELATAVYTEMLLAGYTAVGEFHYLHRRRDGSAWDPTTAMEDAVVAAAASAGIRLTLLDTLYLRGGLTPEGAPLALAPAQRGFSDGSVDAWNSRRSAIATGPTALVGAAIHSARAVPESAFASARAATDGIPVHAHVSEQPAENVAVAAESDRTPTRLFADAGFLGPLFTAVHGTHLSGADIALLGDSRSSVCFCPTTERDLADGIGPSVALSTAGASLTLGSDQNAVIDPFEELRALELDERLSSGRRGAFTPAHLLDAATSAGYASLGWQGGRLEAGAVCDLVALATGSARTAGASRDQLWMAATAADVHTVVVAGVARVRAGEHSLGDVGAALTHAIDRLDS